MQSVPIAITALSQEQLTASQMCIRDRVYVTCKSEMLNTKTGHMEVLPILSGRFVRATMANINLETVDASDALTNFNHAMAFKRASGFFPITPLTDALT